MSKTHSNLLLMEGEIIKVTSADEDDGQVFHAYVLKSIKKDGHTTGYAILPIHIITNDDAGRQKELQLLRTHRGQISDRIDSTSHANRFYRATFELGEIPAQGKWRFAPVDRVQSIQDQKKIEKNLVGSVVNANFSMVNGTLLMVGGIAEARTMPKAKDTPYYIDIDVTHAATAGFIPAEVAHILRKFGKINRLGTAADIANDKDADKLRQIYDRARPNQTMSFEDFSNYTKTGMSYFSTQITTHPDETQAKIPADAILKYTDKEKIKFNFVTRRTDLSIDDAFHTYGFLLQEETYRTLKAAGFKTLRHAFDMVEEHGVSTLRTAFKKAGTDACTLRDIAKDIREAHEAFEETIKKPEDYDPYAWTIQTFYPIRDVK